MRQIKFLVVHIKFLVVHISDSPKDRGDTV